MENATLNLRKLAIFCHPRSWNQHTGPFLPLVVKLNNYYFYFIYLFLQDVEKKILMIFFYNICKSDVFILLRLQSETIIYYNHSVHVINSTIFIIFNKNTLSKTCGNINAYASKRTLQTQLKHLWKWF